MQCKFCKLDDIEQEGEKQFRCSHCGYVFTVSRWDIFYDKVLEMPLSSALIASMMWAAAMLTGIIFGAGINNSSLNTTIIFLYLIGGTAFIYGISYSLDLLEAIAIYILRKIIGKSPNFYDVKMEVQKKRKERIVKEMGVGKALDEATGEHIETDIRPGEKRIPQLAPSLTAGLLTLLLAVYMSILFAFMFQPIEFLNI